MTPIQWMIDPSLCGQTFGGPTWAAARALVCAIFGLPLTPEQMVIYAECTQRTVAPVTASARAMVVAGRGSGKTLLAAFIVVFIAASRDFHPILGPGELATVMLICPDRRQARVAMRYVLGLLRASPMLEGLIVSETRDSITLSTGAVIEIHTASFKSTRGYALAAAVIDECAFLPTDAAANPDVELVRALGPGLARVPGSLLLCISSPYAKRGVLWDAFRRHHGIDHAPVLTWQAPTRRMNPTIDQAVVAEAMEDDAAAAKSEWCAEFRDDLESFIGIDALRACVVAGCTELPPAPGLRYTIAADAAGGSGKDAFAWCVGHLALDRSIIVDQVGEIRPPFSPDAACEQLAAVARAYNVGLVTSDRYAAEWVAERLRCHGLQQVAAPFNRSEAYLAALPWLTGARVQLPDHPKLLAQFANLQRRTSSAGSGKDSVDHPRGGHDDLANSTALMIATVAHDQTREVVVCGPGGAPQVPFGRVPMGVDWGFTNNDR